MPFLENEKNPLKDRQNLKHCRTGTSSFGLKPSRHGEWKSSQLPFRILVKEVISIFVLGL
jgi:hypothetical protein